MEVKISLRDKIKECKASRFNVIILNDNETTMIFVVWVLMDIFKKNTEEAINLMLQVHRQGFGIAGTYSYEVARAKRELTLQYAQEEGFPLRVEIEEC
ncbi:hypothetical protein CCZ01_02950 [Helicobacter monodelphidis]|uniref:ATP-dependent Clp protease adaptor ClpS n=1 Tax=Helicobacter sp. 15-1451 TaxID=2004995 RepID=UPI000DCE1063|nr:ATP-dependent Clp protease adaptor ClpS [Helicobacter sp. 15-1451]RAX58455.1 hypothetical protein CCZ01_02950 [Helicobacter sp. 15-1451]